MDPKYFFPVPWLQANQLFEANRSLAEWEEFYETKIVTHIFISKYAIHQPFDKELEINYVVQLLISTLAADTKVLRIVTR